MKDAPIPFIIITIGTAVVLSVLLYATEVPFAPEGTFEVLICGIGYGVLIPFFYALERERERYGPGH